MNFMYTIATFTKIGPVRRTILLMLGISFVNSFKRGGQ